MSSIVDLSIFLTLQLVVFVDVLLQAWIGPSFLQGIAIIRLLVIGIPFYLFYTALRSPVDAGSVRPLNARNIVVSLMALLIMIALGILVVPREFSLHAIAIFLVLAFALLAYLTRLSLTKLYDVQVHWKESAIPIVCALVLGLLGLAYHKILPGLLLPLAVVELIFTLTFLGVCFYCKVRWVRLLSTMLFRPESTEETVSELVLP
jgi:O-antigen/teichoic acid export membrane protein